MAYQFSDFRIGRAAFAREKLFSDEELAERRKDTRRDAKLAKVLFRLELEGGRVYETSGHEVAFELGRAGAEHAASLPVGGWFPFLAYSEEECEAVVYWMQKVRGWSANGKQ